MTDERVFDKVSDAEITDLMEHIAEDVDITMKKQLEDDELAAVCEIVNYSRTSGGKRLRPTLAVLISQALGGDYQEAMDMATAAEMLHGASLGYDDVLDGDLLRRGKPSAHALFGAGAAMMGSNLLALLAIKMGTVRGLPLLRLLISAASNLALGSTEEQLFHEYSEERYYRIIGLKTASLIQAPCEIGAIVAGVVRPQFMLASRYGWNVGMLYQITDDLVDILKTHMTGEPHGHMKNGSPTLAFIHLARTTKDERVGALLQKFLNDAPLPMKEFEEIYRALVEAGSIEYTFKKIEEHNKLCHKQCVMMPANKFSNYLAAMPGYMHRALMTEVRGHEGLDGMKEPENKEPEKPASV